MILHLLTDDKFADYAIQQFSAPEMQSEFVLVPSNNAMEMLKLADKCKVIRQNSPEFDALLNRLDQYTGIIFHGLFWGQWQTPILQKVPKNVKVAWMFWGGDIYSRHEFNNLFLAPITRFANWLHERKRNIKVSTAWEISLSLFNRIDYCLTDANEEYMLGKTLIGCRFEHLWYNYYSIEETIGALADKQCCGSNVIIGNSSAIKNNHLDVLWRLRKRGLVRCLRDSKVIIPLSYGDQWIRNLVIKEGKWMFENRLLALTDYMPRDEYNALMLSCSTMIIGYTQPAAQGNIITALWLGMRVYLSEKNASYDYFKRIGCKIFSIERDLNRKNPDVFAPMKQEDIDINRTVLRKWYSKEEMHKRNLEIVKALS